ncbi:hypothetical protein [Bacteroides clarus]|uniref:hypothetical protein n=1 Tax=Bacteroides clarus TaxID=626929 RepID=UPI00248E17B8|nr:hypothetical protein [Bacteroides clarus]
MYKVITINGKDYHLEYSIEASLYADCVTKLTTLLTDIESGESTADVKKLLSGFSNVPQTALTIFYAGLMEAHGNHPDGDGSVPDIQAAKRLISEYIKEHKDDETGNFYGIMQMCIDQMGEDGFFKLVGLEAMMASAPKKPRKTPQDHKKASGK